MHAQIRVARLECLRRVGILAVGLWFLTRWDGLILAQSFAPPPVAYAVRGMDELEQLVAPVALYPDALLAQVLAASTYPGEVIAAAQWEDAGNNPLAANSQPWDSSVAGVARYPSVLHYMAAHADWLNGLGDAFLNQQSDVMSAVQLLRAEALAAGTLFSTPQQTVLNQDGYIQIIPTDPRFVFAPIYDPQVVFAPPPYAVGQAFPTYVTFGPQVEVGDWLDFDLDWHDRTLYSGRWGSDRPWWHFKDWGGDYHYLNDRPGAYRPGAFRDRGGRPINAEAAHWARDTRKPPPRPVAGPVRPTIQRPERGYAKPGPPAPNRPAEVPRGADVAKQSERGRTSLGRAAPPPTVAAPRSPQPVREAPRPVTPAPPARAPAPVPAAGVARQARPAPEARPSAPTRGGAMGGYQSGAAASNSAARGSTSRGKR